MKSKIPISIVTTTFNNEDEIVAFLDNIMNQTVAVSEIVISDGGSKDNTVSTLKNYANKCASKIVIRSGSRLNIAEGFNDAIKNTNEDIVCIMGVGNKFPDDFLEKLFLKFSLEHVDVMCPFICGQDNNSFSSAYNKVYLNGNQGVPGNNAPNHGCIAKKSLFYELNFFYEDFVYAGEDAEFFSLARDKGYKINADPDVKVFWDTPHKWKELFKQTKFYAIADAQWVPVKKILWQQKKNLAVSIVFLFSIVGLIFKLTRLLSAALLILLLIGFLRWIVKFGFLGAFIQLVRKYYKMLCYAINIKYFGKRYRVQR